MDLQVSDIKLNLLYPPYINHHYILLFSSFHFLVFSSSRYLVPIEFGRVQRHVSYCMRLPSTDLLTLI